MNCPSCKTVNPDSTKSCMNCGADLSASRRTGVSSKGANGGFLAQYLPQELIAKLKSARSGNALAGERHVSTMLFCDVKGSTAAAETLDPEVWTGIINGAFERMIAPINKYKGFVPRLIGDAINLLPEWNRRLSRAPSRFLKTHISSSHRSLILML